MPFYSKSRVSITALDGIDEVGRANCYLLETPEFNVMLDCGLALEPVAADDLSLEVKDMKIEDNEDDIDDVEVSYPDFENYIEKLRKVKVILISHGHLDHAGALTELYKVLKSHRISLPTVIGGQLTQEILEHLFFDQYIAPQLPFPFLLAQPNQSMVLSHELSIVPVKVPHSFPESFGFYIEIAGKKVFYSGDFKVNDINEEDTATFKSTIEELSRKGVDVLFLETTNIYEQGFTPRDPEIWEELSLIFSEAKGRIIFTTFSSHLKRIEAVIDIAKSQGRPVYACGRNLLFYLQKGGVCGWKRLDKFTHITPKPNALIMVTGCQAERKSVLQRTLKGKAPFWLKPNDTIVISADTIPLPEIESRVKEMVKELLRPRFHGAEVFGRVRPVYINREAPSDFPVQAKRAYIHVSGHEKREGLEWIMTALDPKMVIAIHGDLERRKMLASMAQKQGRKTGILEKGIPMNLA